MLRFEIQVRRSCERCRLAWHRRARPLLPELTQQARHIHQSAATGTSPRRTGRFLGIVASLARRPIAPPAKSDAGDGAAANAKQPGDLPLAVRLRVQEPTNLGNELFGDHFFTSMWPLAAPQSNKKSPPPERTPATGSCGYLASRRCGYPQHGHNPSTGRGPISREENGRAQLLDRPLPWFPRGAWEREQHFTFSCKPTLPCQSER
jgi:hypothetical protein